MGAGITGGTLQGGEAEEEPPLESAPGLGETSKADVEETCVPTSRGGSARATCSGAPRPDPVDTAGGDAPGEEATTTVATPDATPARTPGGVTGTVVSPDGEPPARPPDAT